MVARGRLLDLFAVGGELQEPVLDLSGLVDLHLDVLVIALRHIHART
jgi:hypothetical protein